MTHFLSPQKVRNDRNANHVIQKLCNLSKVERTGWDRLICHFQLEWDVDYNGHINHTTVWLRCISVWTRSRSKRLRQGTEQLLEFSYEQPANFKTTAFVLAHSISLTFSPHPNLCKLPTQLFSFFLIVSLPWSLLPHDIKSTNNYLPTWTRQGASLTPNALHFKSHAALHSASEIYCGPVSRSKKTPTKTKQSPQKTHNQKNPVLWPHVGIASYWKLPEDWK